MRAFLRTLALGLVGAAGLLSVVGPVAAGNTDHGANALLFHRPRRHESLDQKVLAYAKGELHQKVGSGQCWDLVDAALRSAGADTSGDGSYVFGTPIALNDVMPGDCLQFENVSFKHTDPSGS